LKNDSFASIYLWRIQLPFQLGEADRVFQPQQFHFGCGHVCERVAHLYSPD
jgi:hypothetical protein